MFFWRGLTRAVRALIYRRVADREIRDEVEHFFEEAVAERMADGTSTEEARRSVRLEYGSALATAEEVRQSGWESGVLSVLSDARHAIRLLIHHPGFAIVTVATLGLGVGAATAIFSAVRPVLFEPLGYPNAERLVSITDRSPEGSPAPVTFGTYRELAERSHSFDAFAVFRPWHPTVTGDGEPERLEGQRVSADYFRVLGVPPALGRDFDAADDRRGGADVVILSHGLWQRRFGGDSTLPGRYLRLDGGLYRVLGVMPRTFEALPTHSADAWALLQYDISLPTFEGREWGHHLNLMARLAPGVSLDAAQDELDHIARDPVPERARPPWALMRQGLSLVSLQESEMGDAKPISTLLAGAVVLLLIVTSVNVTNLLLARGVRRRGEMAMRAALGATKGRIVRQLLTEGLLLAAVGGAVGMALAFLGVGVLRALGPEGLARAEQITFEGPVFAFAFVVTGLIGVVAALVPVVPLWRHNNMYRGIQASSRWIAAGHRTTRSVLVIAEVALAVILLSGAGLLLRSMLRLSEVHTGFDAAGVLVMQVQTAGPRFGTGEGVNVFFEEALTSIRGIPGVHSVAVTTQLPLSGDQDVYGMRTESDPRPDAVWPAFRYAVSPGYFAVMGIPLVRGRELPDPIAGGVPSVVLSASLARAAFQDRDPIGQQIHLGRTDVPWSVVVGVVGDVTQVSLESGSAEAVYVSPREWYGDDSAFWIVVRAERDPEALLPLIKQAVWSVDPDQAILRIATMESVVARSEARRRFALIVLETFAVLALGLAVIGLYGVVSGSVTERWHELGVRTALGASGWNIRGVVLRQGMVLTGTGILIGLAGAIVASDAVATLLFGTSHLDPITYLVVVLVLGAASLLASWIPASRAAAIDPAKTLRTD